jgi:uncharacterized protein (TIGR00730 family)
MNNQPLAYFSRDFLQSPDGRPMRILAEYLEPLSRFRRARIQDTVVFFGSARVSSRERAERDLLAMTGAADRPVDPARGRPDQDRGAAGREADERLARARRALDWSRYYEDARSLAHLLTTWTLTLESRYRRFVVCSGGGPGIMEAANRGAREAGGQTIGLNIRLPFEQGANPYVSDGLHLEFHYFFMRKFWFAYLAKALVVFPGGFGTLDEMFEILTLAQTEKLSKKIAVLLYGREYWERVLNFEPMLEVGAISPKDMELFTHVDSPGEAFEALQEHLVQTCLQPAVAEEPQAPLIAKTRT